MRGLDGRIAVVTGGARGLGNATVKRLAEEGVKVAILDLLEEEAADVAKEIGGVSYKCDTTDLTQLTDAMGAVRDIYGGLDILINNAGIIAPRKDWQDWQKEDLARFAEINYIGYFLAIKAAYPMLRASNHGRIINISSDAGRVGSSGEAVYAGCKGAVIAFGKTLARELARTSITVNTVCPGPTDTAFLRGVDETGRLQAALEKAIPMKRLGQPEDYPGIIAFLASDDADYITGQVISVSGGLTMHG